MTSVGELEHVAQKHGDVFHCVGATHDTGIDIHSIFSKSITISGYVDAIRYGAVIFTGLNSDCIDHRIDEFIIIAMQYCRYGVSFNQETNALTCFLL